MEKPTAERFTWRFPAIAATVSIVVFLGLVLPCPEGELDYWLAAIGFSLLALVWAALSKGYRRWSILSMVAICFLVPFILPSDYYGIRTTLRWALWSTTYKSELLAQSLPSHGAMQHLEWDSWGFTGNYTTAYLVYDPHNLLAIAAEGRLPGVVLTPEARPVAKVRQLEKSWYSVIFYTQMDWEHGD